MNLHFAKYSATGNIIGVAYYSDIFDIDYFVKNHKERIKLRKMTLKEGCDSVMILIKNRDLFETIVFEPSGNGIIGNFSTMCGNGVRAVALFAEQHLKNKNWPLKLKTKSGILNIEKIGNKNYKVLMGAKKTESRILAKYVNLNFFPKQKTLESIELPSKIIKKLKDFPFDKSLPLCSIGINTTSKKEFDGEPHLVIRVAKEKIKNLKSLQVLAQKYGEKICKDLKFFPKEINVNFVIENNVGSFLICTYERNLGKNPKKCVTKACGTGCTFASSTMFKKDEKSLIAKNLGGDIKIEKIKNLFYMSGGVKEI